MKGKATIILSDAKTGKVVKQMEEHNLVTNAISNIFNPPHSALVHGFDYSTLFTKGLPIWKDLLGGIVLLGNTETENADNIMLGKNIVPVATAGSEYAGSCTMRGTLNLNESYATDNGYHFTWDFGTDKANGTISCVCLTNRKFGDSGFGADGNATNAFMLIAPNMINSDSSSGNSTMTVEKGYGQYVGTYEDGLHVYMYFNGDGNVELRRYKGFDTSAVKINDTTGLASVSLPVSVTTVPIGMTLANESNYFVDQTTKTVYLFASTCESNTAAGTTTITYTAVDIMAGTASSRTVTLDRSIYYSAVGAVFDGHIFMQSNDGLYEFTESGASVRKHEVSNSANMAFAVIDDVLVVRLNSGYSKFISWNDNEFRTGHGDHLTAGKFPRPYVAVATRSGHAQGAASTGNIMRLALATWYKATINNLSSPVTKTSEHTLKIVYDITN